MYILILPKKPRKNVIIFKNNPNMTFLDLELILISLQSFSNVNQTDPINRKCKTDVLNKVQDNVKKVNHQHVNSPRLPIPLR